MSQPNQNNNTNFRYTKIFVGNLTWRTTTDDLRNCFQVLYGEVIDANVVSAALPGGQLRSKGYGFVVFRYAESANAACRLPWPVIDGRQTNVNMAYIGAKNNTNQSNQNGFLNQAGPSHQYQNGLLNQAGPSHQYQNGLLNQAGPSHQYQNGLFNQAASRQYQLASQNPNPYFPQPYWAPYHGHHPYMYNVPCYSYPTTMESEQMRQHVLAYRMQRHWERMNNLPSVTITKPPNEEIIEANEANEANVEVNEGNEKVYEAIEEIVEADEEIIEEMNEADADTEANSDQEGEISGEVNDIEQNVNDQDLEIMSGEENDTKQEQDVTKQLGNGVEVTLQSEIVCEEEL